MGLSEVKPCDISTNISLMIEKVDHLKVTSADKIVDILLIIYDIRNNRVMEIGIGKRQGSHIIICLPKE